MSYLNSEPAPNYDNLRGIINNTINTNIKPNLLNTTTNTTTNTNYTSTAISQPQPFPQNIIHPSAVPIQSTQYISSSSHPKPPSNIPPPSVTLIPQSKPSTPVPPISINALPRPVIQNGQTFVHQSSGASSRLALLKGNVANVGQLGNVAQVVAEAPKPHSTSRIQYVPYNKKVVDYETKQIVNTMWVPIQKKCLNYYAVQHITEYLPREIQDIRYEMVPQEYVDYRLEYRPVQKTIVHMPQDVQQQQLQQQQQQHAGANGVYMQGGKTVGNGVAGVQQIGGGQGIMSINSGNTGIGYEQSMWNTSSIPGYVQLQTRNLTSRTNFVTTDGYVPSYSQSNSFLKSILQPKPKPTPSSKPQKQPTSTN